MERSRKISIRAPGVEVPGKECTWGGKQGLCEFLVAAFLVLLPQLAAISGFKQVGFYVLGLSHQLRWIFCYWKLLSISRGSVAL